MKLLGCGFVQAGSAEGLVVWLYNCLIQEQTVLSHNDFLGLHRAHVGLSSTAEWFLILIQYRKGLKVKVNQQQLLCLFFISEEFSWLLELHTIFWTISLQSCLRNCLRILSGIKMSFLYEHPTIPIDFCLLAKWRRQQKQEKKTPALTASLIAISPLHYNFMLFLERLPWKWSSRKSEKQGETGTVSRHRQCQWKTIVLVKWLLKSVSKMIYGAPL